MTDDRLSLSEHSECLGATEKTKPRQQAEHYVCPTCGHVQGELHSFTLGSKWRWFWRGFFGFFWPPLLPPDVPHIFDRRRS